MESHVESLFVSQAPDGENQPSTEVDLFVSVEKVMVLNTDLQVSGFKVTSGVSALAYAALGPVNVAAMSLGVGHYSSDCWHPLS